MTGPVIKLDSVLASPLVSSRWRTLAPEAHRPTGWATADRERCPASCNDRRCMLREGHLGVHAWRSLGGLRIFEWDRA